MDIQTYLGDSFQIMPVIPAHSVHMIFADIPYNMTVCKWDNNIWNLDQMWVEFNRVLTKNGVIIMTASEPFNVRLINSNSKMFRYSWVWVKNLASGMLNVRKMPLKNHELVLIFYNKLPTYNPIMTDSPLVIRCSTKPSSCYGKVAGIADYTYCSSKRYPKSVQGFKCVSNSIRTSENRIRHPTEKPVELIEYMIKTYTNEGDTILDPCMGTGASLLASYKSDRNFIGIELEKQYYDTSLQRLYNLFS